MAKQQDEHPRYWRQGANWLNRVGAECRPGDGLARLGGDDDWRALRHRLAERLLAVVAVGRRLFVAPWAALPEMPLLQQVATAAAGGDKVARRALTDLTQDLFGPVRGLAAAFADACKGPQQHLTVPGGELSTSPRQVKAITPASISAEAVDDLSRRTAKLSKLQRRLLAFARDFAPRYGSALLGLWGRSTRSEAAALSRALRRLEARGLLNIGRVGGRAVNISLTRNGQKVAGPLERRGGEPRPPGGDGAG